MATLHLLGTGAALSDAARTTTMLAFENADSVVMVDCGGDAVQRLLAAGLSPARISALIVTHEHPDHVSGFPLFMEKVWLAKRSRPLSVYGPGTAIRQAERVLGAFDTSGWEGMPEIRWNEIALEEGAPVLEDRAWRITSAPGRHSVPCIGLRVEDRRGGRAVAYSSDTEPSPAITRLASGADLLVHEATGDFPGHTSAEDAARIAADAGAGRLVLVHLPPGMTDSSLDEARKRFSRTELGRDGGRYEF